MQIIKKVQNAKTKIVSNNNLALAFDLKLQQIGFPPFFQK